MAGIYRPSGGTASSRGRLAAIINSGVGLEPPATGVESIMSRAVLMGVPKKIIGSMRTASETSADSATACPCRCIRTLPA